MNEPAGLDGVYVEGREYAVRLLFSIEHFRKGEDRKGLDYLADSMERLGRLLEEPDLIGNTGMEPREIIPELRALLSCMRNEDITGLTDILEFTLYPAARIFLEGWDQL